MKGIDVIILVGGKGTRLQGILPQVPKPLAPINGKPFLDIVFSQIKKCSQITKIVLAVCHMAHLIIEHYKNQGHGIPIDFAIEREPLGTGGAIKNALKLTSSENVLCMNGDSFIEMDINDFIGTHLRTDRFMTIAIKRIENTDRYGFVKLTEHNRIVSFEEKRKGIIQGYINSGVYIFKRTIFDTIKENTCKSLEKELLPKFINQGVYGYVTSGKFIDIGTPESYKAATSFFTEVN